VTGELVTVRGGLGDSLDQITDFDSPSWTLGVNLKVPIGNNDAKATLAQRRFEEQREALELRSLQQDITHQVRLAVRALHDGAANVDAAESSRELQERNVEAEQTKFQNGLSTNFQVLQVQDQLANAQEAEIRARLNYRKSLVEYRVATGTLLPTLDVRVTDPAPRKRPTATGRTWAGCSSSTSRVRTWLRMATVRTPTTRVRPATTRSDGIRFGL
jgi:outer membrane protein